MTTDDSKRAEELKRLFEEHADIERLRGSREPAIVRTVWTTPGPLAIDGSVLTSDAKLADPAIRRKVHQYVEYGLDERGRPIIGRVRDGDRYGGEIVQEQLVWHRADGLVAALFENWAGKLELHALRLRTHDATGRYLDEIYHRFAGFFVERSDELATSPPAPTWEPESVEQVLDAMAEEIRASVHASIASPWLVVVRYISGGPSWRDAWPTVSAASSSDRPKIEARVLAEDDWSAGWDWPDWSVPECDVMFSARTIDGLRSLDERMRMDDVQNVMGKLRERLAAADPTTIYLAVEDSLENLAESLEALPGHQVAELARLGMVPQRR